MSGGIDPNISGGFTFTTSPISYSGGSTPAINGAATSIELPLSAIAAFANTALDFSQSNSNNNRGFLSGVINNAQSNVNDTAGQAFGFQKGVLNLFDNINSSVQNTVQGTQGGGFCFITTAICREGGKPDDCEELTVLRRFRDEVLQHATGGPEMIAEYYRIAPAIVEAIDKSPDAARIYVKLRDVYLRCVLTLIGCGEYDAAISVYRKMVAAASSYAGE